MASKTQGSILMSYYKAQKTNRLNNNINIFGNTTSFVSLGSDASSISDVQQNVSSFQFIKTNSHISQGSESSDQIQVDAWMEEEQSIMKLQKKSSLEKEKKNFFKRFPCRICPPIFNACCVGLIIGSLLAGVALAVVLTIWLKAASTNTSTETSTTVTTSTTTTTTIVTTTTTSTTTTVTTSTTSTSVTTSTTSTTTTTTQASAVAYSSLTSYCSCSGFTLSLASISFSTINTTYQWQSSPTGQNIWTNINMPSATSSLYKASQVNSADYQCQIFVLYPTPMNLTSTIVTVMTTTNISYCQTILNDCSSFGDDLNNFILFGELGTNINDLNTNCSLNIYDNRTQKSVSLYENTNYTAQASSHYTGGGEELVIWIDFNNNFQFESSEKVAYQPLNLTYNTDVIIAIPSSSLGAAIGVHVMRATLAFSVAPNSCGTSSTYGETHDYTVNILSFIG